MTDQTAARLAPPSRPRPGLWLAVAVAGFLFSVLSPVGLLLGVVAVWVGITKALPAKSALIRWAGGGVCALVAAALAVGIHVAIAPSRDPGTSAATNTSPKGWEIVKTWSGSGMKETERFRTTSREWRIRWQTRNEPFTGAGIFQVMVHDASGRMVTIAANKQGPGSDVSYVRSTPGEHYLMFNSANIDYTVTVEEER